jgi:DNA helicase-2/ATP-dependent DNA helicase PcrA
MLFWQTLNMGIPLDVCNNCQVNLLRIKCRCQLPSPIPADMEESVLDELSVFYVGITRARKQVFVSASAKRFKANGDVKQSNFSCFSSIRG